MSKGPIFPIGMPNAAPPAAVTPTPVQVVFDTAPLLAMLSQLGAQLAALNTAIHNIPQGSTAAPSGVVGSDVVVTSSALPTGASTEAKQDSMISAIGGISFALPAGASTSAKQDSIITAIGAIPAAPSTVTANLGTLNGAATAAKQDSIVTAIGSIPAAPSTVTANLGTLNGAATSAKQDTQSVSLTTIAEWAGDLKVYFRQLLEALRYPGALDRALNRLRGTVIVESLPTLANVTTVATTTNLAQFATHQAQSLVLNTERMSWALTCRARIS